METHLPRQVQGKTKRYATNLLTIISSTKIFDCKINITTLIFRDRSSGISGNRVGGPKDSGNLRHSSNRPMSSSPSRMSGEIHNQHRGPGYQQHGGAEGHSASSGNTGVADGVYSNKRLMHACTCLIGTTVQVNFAIRIIWV